MAKRFNRSLIAFAAIACIVAPGSRATAEPGLVIAVDEARVLNLMDTPAVVVVGNPMVADVSVQRGKLIVTGKTYGSTNLILMDNNGRTQAEMLLTVGMNNASRVSVYRAGAQYSYACTETCDPEVVVGDEPGYFSNITKEITGKISLATGKGETGQ